ncbi:MAG TPA: winged helix-turn-helix domain-containing protein [Amycolatopsis sp.]|nr:winged helix-turn-helix domain-containing protein [Amycolatopsis sp.]
MTTTTHLAEALPRLDRVLTDPTRLLIAAALVRPASRRIDEVADTVEVAQPELQRHLRRLREVGYIETRRDEQRHGWVWITEEGHERLLAHLRALRLVLAKVDTLVVSK